MSLSPDATTSLLTSLFPSSMIDDLAREREVVRERAKARREGIVCTLIIGFAAGGREIRYRNIQLID